MARTKRKRTRSVNFDPEIGGPADFIPNEVPTLRDCLRKIQFERLNQPNATIATVIDLVSQDIIQAWEKSNALFRDPIIIHQRCIYFQLKKAYYVFYNQKNKKKTMSKKYFTLHKSRLDHLFDITRCRCPIVLCDAKDTPCRESCSVSSFYTASLT